MNRRQFARTTGAAVAATPFAPVSSWSQTLDSQADSEIRITRLTWAGLKLEMDGTTLLIDPILTDIWEGDRPFPIQPLDIEDGRRHVLITHTHNDHYDKLALSEAVTDRGRVVCHARAAREIAGDGYRVRPLELYQPARLGSFMVAAVPAVDGFGHPAGQVSWVVKVGGFKAMHAGDTLWHGEFWNIGAMYGPFDAVFLPINGVRVPGYTPVSDVPATMTPEQAVAAGIVLEAGEIVPIHYGHSNPEFYIEYPDALDEFTAAGVRRGIHTRVVEVGESISFPVGA